jgi:drug/metabolite transporter (DMT)-like permease
VELTETFADARREDFARLGLAMTAFFWAAAFIAGKVVLAEMTPLTVAAWRFGIAGGVLLPFALRQFPGWPALRRSARPLALMTLCGGILYQWIFLAALSRTSAANTSLLIALNPIFTLCLSVLVGERLSSRNAIGALLALTGAALVITHGDWAAVTRLAVLNTGDLLALLGALCWACFNLASRGVAVRLPHVFTNGLVYGIGGLVLYAISWHEAPVRQLLDVSPAALGSLAMMAIVSSVLAGLFFLHGVRVLGVNRTVIFIYLVPVLTALLSVVVLGEPLRLPQVIGGALALSGIYFATKPRVVLAKGSRLETAGVGD